MSASIPNDVNRPRLCHLRKWPDFNGYGFNLHAERGKTGHYVGSLDPCSPAEAAGLRIEDRIVEVNGVNVGNENHRQVVERVKSVANETKLLVIDKEGDAFYLERKIVVTGDMPDVEYRETPAVNPYTEGKNMYGHVVTGDAAEVSSMKSNNSSDSVGIRGTSGSFGNDLQFPSSAKEAREKMSKKRNVKSGNMTLKDKYDLLQQL